MIKSSLEYRLQTVSDLYAAPISEFRKSICLENGGLEDYFDQNLSYQQTEAYYKDVMRGQGVFEEVWKFGQRKWQETSFAAIEVAVHNKDKKVVSLSGCRHYSQRMLRVGMHLYTLQNYRKTCRNIQFSEHGFFRRHIDYAKASGKVDCLFMTVFVHNKTLEAHVKNLAKRRISPDGGELFYIHDLEFIEKPIKFHNVPQYFFLYPLVKDFCWSMEAPVVL